MERSDVRHVESVFIPRRTPDRTTSEELFVYKRLFCIIARENWREANQSPAR